MGRDDPHEWGRRHEREYIKGLLSQIYLLYVYLSKPIRYYEYQNLYEHEQSC